LWLAQLISLAGDWFNTIAVVILINTYTDDSALAVSILFLGRALPVFVTSPFAGVIADRFDRRMVMVVSNWARVLVVLGFLLVDRSERVWLIYVLTVSQFTISAFFEPAYAAITPSLVQPEELLTANSLNSITWSAMLTLGAAIGGLVAGIAGIQAALLIDAASFAVAGTMTYLVKPAFMPDLHHRTVETNRLTELVEGFRYVRQHVDVGLVTLVKAMAQIGTVDVTISVYADRVFVVGENGATTLGILFAAHGLGAVLGPLIGDWIHDGSQTALLNWISIGFSMVVLGWFIIGVGPTLPVVALGGVLRGVGGSINWTYSSVLIQMKVPDRYLGRVFGLDFAIFTLALSAATLLAGFCLDTLQIPPRTMVLYVSAGSLIPLSIWMLALRWQQSPVVQESTAEG
jgi:MFS family permease